MNLVKIEPSFFKPYFDEDRIEENLFLSPATAQ